MKREKQWFLEKPKNEVGGAMKGRRSMCKARKIELFVVIKGLLQSIGEE